MGINTEGTASDDLFNVHWKVKIKTILSKIPIIGKKFEWKAEGETKFGKVEFNPGTYQQRHEEALGITPSGNSREGIWE